MDTVRVLRIIEYVGDRDWVENTLEKSINGTKSFKKGVIKSAIIDNFPNILNTNTKGCFGCKHTNEQNCCEYDSELNDKCLNNYLVLYESNQKENTTND